MPPPKADSPPLFKRRAGDGQIDRFVLQFVDAGTPYFAFVGCQRQTEQAFGQQDVKLPGCFVEGILVALVYPLFQIGDALASLGDHVRKQRNGAGRSTAV